MTTDLEDDEIARLMALSDEEILAEARAEGIDTDKLAYEMAEQFKVIAKLVRERDKARELLGRSWVRNAQWSREVRDLRAALESIAASTCCDRCQEAALVARQALAAKFTPPA